MHFTFWLFGGEQSTATNTKQPYHLISLPDGAWGEH